MPACLLAPWLDERSTVALIRTPRADATQLALAVALAVATGCSVSGWSAPRSLDVLYLTDREDTQGLRRRLDILGPAVTPALGSEPLARLHVITTDHAPPDPATPTGAAWMSALITRTCPALVVLDCTASVELLRDLRGLGCSVLLLMSPEAAERAPLGYVGQLIDLKTSADGHALSWRKPGGLNDFPVALPGLGPNPTTPEKTMSNNVRLGGTP